MRVGEERSQVGRAVRSLSQHLRDRVKARTRVGVQLRTGVGVGLGLGLPVPSCFMPHVDAPGYPNLGRPGNSSAPLVMARPGADRFRTRLHIRFRGRDRWTICVCLGPRAVVARVNANCQHATTRKALQVAVAQQIGEALAWLALGLGLWIGVGRGRGLVGWQGSCLSRAVRTRAAEARRPWHPRRFRRLRSGREVAGIALRAPPRSRRTRARDPLCHRPLPLGTHASAEARATSTQHDHGSARRGRKRAWPRRRRHCHISRLGPRAVRAWEAGFEVRWPCGTCDRVS